MNKKKPVFGIVFLFLLVLIPSVFALTVNQTLFQTTDTNISVNIIAETYFENITVTNETINMTDYNQTGSYLCLDSNSNGICGYSEIVLNSSDSLINYTLDTPNTYYLITNSINSGVTQISPSNTEYLVGDDVDLVYSFEDYNTTTNCSLYADSNANPTTIVDTTGFIPANTVTYTYVPAASGTYYWKVNCTNPEGLSNETGAWSFTLDFKPDILNITINNTDPYADEDVSTTVEIFNYLGNLVNVVFDWFVNGVLAFSETIGITDSGNYTSILGSGNYSAGDNISVATTVVEYDLDNTTVLYNQTIQPNMSDFAGWWKFDGDALDSSENGNNGTVVGAILTTDRRGNNESSYYFNGSGSYINITELNEVSKDKNYTVSAWFYNNKTIGAIWQNTLSASDRNGMVTNPAGTEARFGYYNGASYTSASGAISLETWNHLVGVNDEGAVSLYINGVLQTGTTAPSLSGTAIKLQIGRGGTNNNIYANGSIDDVRIYTRALTPQEVQTLYLADTVGLQAVVNNSVPTYANEIPTNGSTNQLMNPYLSITVYDIDLETVDVSFYNNATSAQIGSTQTGVTNGSTAQVQWTGLDLNTTYGWYVNITDGTYDVQSGIYNFTTGNLPNATIPIINNTNPFTNESIQANTTVTDADGDLLTVTFNWFVNGILKFIDLFIDVLPDTVVNSTLGSGNYSVGDEISVEVIVADQISDLNAISWWKFDGDAVDEIGGNDGTIFGATSTSGKLGVENSALYFDGADDYIVIGNPVNLQFGTNPSTISFWYKADGLDSQIRYAYSKTNGTKGAVSFLIHEGDFGAEIGDEHKLSDRDDLDDNVWHNVITVYNQTNFVFYVDGFYDSEALISLPPTSFSDNIDVWIGAYNNTGSGYIVGEYKGALDDMRIFDRAINPNEVTLLYNLFYNEISVNSTINATVNNTPPSYGSNVPANGQIINEIPIKLNITVYDNDLETVDVSFYDNLTDTLIGSTQTGVTNGSTAQVEWSTPEYDSVNYWYVNITDGNYMVTSSLFYLNTTNPLVSSNLSLYTTTRNSGFIVDLNYTNMTEETLTCGVYDNSTNVSCTSGDGSSGFYNSTCSVDGSSFAENITFTPYCNGTNETNGTPQSIYFTVSDFVIDMLSPTFENYTALTNETNQTDLVLNFTVSDTTSSLTVDKCWYTLDTNVSDEISIPLCNETGTFNLTLYNVSDGEREVVVYVNDTFGELWDKSEDFIINQVNFTNNVLETTLNNFSIRLYGLGVSPSSPTINYNETNWTMTITDEGSNTYLLTKSIAAPINLNNTDFYFMWDSERSQNYTQVIRTGNIGLCSNLTNLTSPIVTFYTRDADYPRSLINTTLVFTLTYSIGESGGEKTYTFEDLTEDNSTYEFCTVNETLEFFGSMVTISNKAGYNTLTNYYPSINFTTVIPKEYTFYLSDNATTNPTVIELISTAGIAQEGLNIVMQTYYADLDAFIETGSGITSVLGDEIFYMRWYDTIYRFIYTKDGEVIMATGSLKISKTPTRFILPFEITNDYEHFDGIEYSLDFNNVTNQFTLTYVDSLGQISEGCLMISKTGVMNTTIVDDTCVASHSATLFYVVNTSVTGNGTYIATFYASGSPLQVISQIFAEIGEIHSTLQLAFKEALGDSGATFVAIIIVGTVAFTALISPVLAVIATILGLLIAWASGMLTLPFASVIAVVLVGGFIMWGIRK